MFGLPGGIEWIIIGLIALLIFGKRLPEVMRSIGKGISEFKHGMHDVNDEMPDLTDVDASPKSIEPPRDKDDSDHAETSDEDADSSAPETEGRSSAAPDTKDGKDMAG